jgi:hypothetical protein
MKHNIIAMALALLWTAPVLGQQSQMEGPGKTRTESSASPPTASFPDESTQPADAKSSESSSEAAPASVAPAAPPKWLPRPPISMGPPAPAPAWTAMNTPPGTVLVYLNFEPGSSYALEFEGQDGPRPIAYCPSNCVVAVYPGEYRLQRYEDGEKTGGARTFRVETTSKVTAAPGSAVLRWSGVALAALGAAVLLGPFLADSGGTNVAQGVGAILAALIVGSGAVTAGVLMVTVSLKPSVDVEPLTFRARTDSYLPASVLPELRLNLTF